MIKLMICVIRMMLFHIGRLSLSQIIELKIIKVIKNVSCL